MLHETLSFRKQLQSKSVVSHHSLPSLFDELADTLSKASDQYKLCHSVRVSDYSSVYLIYHLFTIYTPKPGYLDFLCVC